MTLETIIIEFLKLSIAVIFGFGIAAMLAASRDQDNN